MTRAGTAVPRIDWVDYSKGICIIMVVMMHSTLGVQLAAGHDGFMNAVVEFAKPFRMPDFFLISGLFLGRVIDRDWRTFLDRKVMHFAYFYVLWVTIQSCLPSSFPLLRPEDGWRHTVLMYFEACIDPFGTLWFIYLLPIFFVVTKATRRVPPAAIWILAAALETARINTGWTAIDEFAARFVYFYSGYLFATTVFAFADGARARPRLAFAGLMTWACAEIVLVKTGISEWPLVSLVLGFVGANAVIVTGVLLARHDWLRSVRYCGQHSIVIYLAFFLPMALTRTLLLETHVIENIGVISLIVTAVGVMGSLIIWWTTRGTWLNFLFERPAAFWIAPKQMRPSLQPAE